MERMDRSAGMVGLALALAARRSRMTLPVYGVSPGWIRGQAAARGMARGQFRRTRSRRACGVVGTVPATSWSRIEGGGGVFLADFDQLWNPAAKPRTPSEAARACGPLRRARLLPQGAQVRPAGFSAAWWTTRRAPETTLDVRDYAGEMGGEAARGGEATVPVVGGGLQGRAGRWRRRRGLHRHLAGPRRRGRGPQCGAGGGGGRRSSGGAGLKSYQHEIIPPLPRGASVRESERSRRSGW